ncbi:MAG: primosomal protein N', partial [Pseudomonadota bacterium]
RADKPGLALLQTFQPEHPVIRAILSGDEEGFWAAEAREREVAGVPPFGRMAGILLSSTDMQEAFDIGGQLARNDQALRDAGAQVFGPAPAPIARIRGRHRVRLLVKAPKGVALQPALARWIAPVRGSSNFRLSIDIDPQSFF